jgi:predicted SAM-dependent methyltransferase
MFRNFIRNIRASYRKFVYSGNKYDCPFCGFKSKGFYTIGQVHEANIVNSIVGAGVRDGGCVSCDCVDRDRLLFAYFNDEVGVFKNDEALSILHLAPEWRLTENFLKFKYKNYICIDKFMPGYSYPKHTIVMDILNISFPENTFDWIICNHVLEHIPDDRKAMSELFRVLKPGGKAVLQVPISKTLKATYENPNVTTDSERIQHYGQYDHVRIYANDYVDRLTEAGFKVDRINISEKYKHYGLIADEDLFICSK